MKELWRESSHGHGRPPSPPRLRLSLFPELLWELPTVAHFAIRSLPSFHLSVLSSKKSLSIVPHSPIPNAESGLAQGALGKCWLGGSLTSPSLNSPISLGSQKAVRTGPLAHSSFSCVWFFFFNLLLLEIRALRLTKTSQILAFGWTCIDFIQ